MKKLFCAIVCIIPSFLCSMDKRDTDYPVFPHRTKIDVLPPILKRSKRFDSDPIQIPIIQIPISQNPIIRRVRSQSEENSRFVKEENLKNSFSDMGVDSKK